MLLDINRLYIDFHIPIAPRHHKHARRGWVNTICPFHQGSSGGYHLGYSLEKGYFFCWGCGWHPENLTIQVLTQSDFAKAKKLLLYYKIDSPAGQYIEEEHLEHPDKLKWPEGYGRMAAAHKNYLLKRDYDPEQLEKEWNLGGTQYWGYWSFRIVAPITFEGEVVSWQSRDITDRHSAKYLPCPQEDELLPHKQILYGLDKAKEWKTVVVVEGITGVWRLGPGAVATFGTQFTQSQLLLLAQNFDKTFILNDQDDAGQASASKMAIDLGGMGKEVEILEPIGCDSGDMPQKLADEIMEEVRR